MTDDRGPASVKGIAYTNRLLERCTGLRPPADLGPLPTIGGIYCILLEIF